MGGPSPFEKCLIANCEEGAIGQTARIANRARFRRPGAQIAFHFGIDHGVERAHALKAQRIPKGPGRLSSAGMAGPVPRGQPDGVIKEEQLGPPTAAHQFATRFAAGQRR